MGVMKIAVRGEDWRNGYGKEKKKDDKKDKVKEKGKNKRGLRIFG